MYFILVLISFSMTCHIALNFHYHIIYIYIFCLSFSLSLTRSLPLRHCLFSVAWPLVATSAVACVAAVTAAVGNVNQGPQRARSLTSTCPPRTLRPNCSLMREVRLPGPSEYCQVSSRFSTNPMCLSVWLFLDQRVAVSPLCCNHQLQRPPSWHQMATIPPTEPTQASTNPPPLACGSACFPAPHLQDERERQSVLTSQRAVYWRGGRVSVVHQRNSWAQPPSTLPIVVPFRLNIERKEKEYVCFPVVNSLLFFGLWPHNPPTQLTLFHILCNGVACTV